MYTNDYYKFKFKIKEIKKDWHKKVSIFIF
jgi:hypothetical protein